MKHKTSNTIALTVGIAVVFSLLFLLIPPTFAQQGKTSQAAPSAQHKQALATFDKHVKDYVKLREGLEGKMPKLPDKSTPERIEAHKNAFEDSVRAARAGAKHGDIFSPQISEYIRAIIRNEFKGKDRLELRKMVYEADTKGVPLRVNYTYPDNKELIEMPPTLLLRLPQLPKQMRYRFVNQNMLLVDRENGLIIDYMVNAIP